MFTPQSLPSSKPLHAEIAALQQEIILLETDPTLRGVTTRAGWERRHNRGKPFGGDIIFLDVDNMKSLNSRHGYSGTNALMQAGFDLGRATDHIFRWLQGDEFIAMLRPGDAPGFLARLQTAFEAVGISFTALYVTYNGCQPANVIRLMADALVRAKDAGQKGTYGEFTL